MTDGKAFNFWAHFDDLRVRITRAAISVFCLFVISISFSSRLLTVLKKPLQDVLPQGANVLHFTGPMDVFMVNVKIALFMSVVFGAPFWLYQFWKFIEPALYPRERKYVFPFVAASVSCFFLGVAFSYFLMLPMSLQYLVGMGLEVALPIITVTDYISLLSVMTISCGLVFETPVLLVLLAHLGIVSADMLAAQRRVIFVLILIASAILTPPDPISMIAMAIPCYLMFEISILVIRYITRPARAA